MEENDELDEAELENMTGEELDEYFFNKTLNELTEIDKEYEALPVDKKIERLINAFPETPNEEYLLEEITEAFLKIGEIAIPSLISALRSDDKYIRCYSARTLGYFKAKEGFEALVELLKDDEANTWAAYALADIGDKRALNPLKSLLTELENDALAEQWKKEMIKENIERLNPSKLEPNHIDTDPYPF